MFRNRVDAGRQLGAKLLDAGAFQVENAVVLGLPRGGVPVAFEVAKAIAAPLDVIVVRKLGLPWQPELAMGAIGEDGVRVLNPEVLSSSRVSESSLAAAEARERAELEAQVAKYRRGRPRLTLYGRTAVIVDDGIATGSTARAACQVAGMLGAASVALAVPVAPPDTLAQLAKVADHVIALESPHLFIAVGEWYLDFSQTTDDEVVALLELAASRPTGGPRK